MQLVEQRYTNVGVTHYCTIDLFGIGSPQESHGNPPMPPLKHCNKKSAADKHVCRRYIKEEEVDNDCDDCYNDDDNENDGDN